MRILVLNRNTEIRHIKSVVDRLAREHEVIIAQCEPTKNNYSWAFVFLHSASEYEFYFERMKEQVSYYKERALRSSPRWFQFIVPFLPSLGFLLRFVSPESFIVNKLREIKPDLIISPSLMLLPTFEDCSMALAAKKLGIPLWGFTPTWDSLTTKSFTFPKPDKMFAWNEAHKEQLMKYHGLKEKTIRVVGAYSFEEWLQPGQAQRRDKFCRKYGFDAKKPILLYLYSSPTVWGDEELFVMSLAENNPQAQILVQLHPDKVKMTALRETDRIKFSSTPAYDNYCHAESIWGLNTSAFFEASLMGKKVNVVHADALQDSIHFRSFTESKKPVREWLGLEGILPSQRVLLETKNMLQ